MPRKSDPRKKERYYDPFPTRLRELIEANRVTQQALADYLGVTRQMVTNYQDGSTIPNIEVLSSLSKFFSISSDWLLGLSEYTHDINRTITLDELGFCESSVKQISSIAGAVVAASEFGEQANNKVSTVQNPQGFTCLQEARAFYALNAILEEPEVVRVLDSIWAYIQYSGQFDTSKTMRLGGEDLPEPFDTSCKVLVDALWNRVTEPLRNILDKMAAKEARNHAKKE